MVYSNNHNECSVVNLSDIVEVRTSHLAGVKKVFLQNSDTETPMTQFAYAELEAFSTIEEHEHPTMEELFFILEGTGTLTINNHFFNLKKGAFIRIPAKTLHQFTAGSQNLKFVYFGIAID